jgi:hypothetical protein
MLSGNFVLCLVQNGAPFAAQFVSSLQSMQEAALRVWGLRGAIHRK